MKLRLLKLLLRLTRCNAGEPYWTYDSERPWITHCFAYTDRALRLFGRSIVLAECCICGVTEDIVIREGDRRPGQRMHPDRERFVREHIHPGVNRNPKSWELPLRNPAALQDGDLEDILGIAVNRAQRDAGGGSS